MTLFYPIQRPGRARDCARLWLYNQPFSPRTRSMLRPAKRTDRIMPFYVVELFKQAAALNAQGRDVISLGIGEPDFTAPPQVVETMRRAAQAGLSGYTAPAGLATLRDAIAHYYTAHFSAPVDAGRVLVPRSEERSVGKE